MMRKKINYCEMNNIGELLDGFVNAPNLKRGLKLSTLFKCWDKVVGKKFENKSRAENLTSDNVLIVACANSFVTSELSMFKSNLIKKVNAYAQPLGFEVMDIRFSHKIWKNDVTSQNGTEQFDNPNKEDLSGFDADLIELEPDVLQKIKENVDKNTFATLEQRERMFRTIVLDMKIQKFLKMSKKSL